jgi:hypothetical protein
MNKNENKPMFMLESDDDKSMTSEFIANVYKPLDVVEFKHYRQHSYSNETIILYPHQLELLAKFCTEAKQWIDSGYKDEFKPEYYNETEDRRK